MPAHFVSNVIRMQTLQTQGRCGSIRQSLLWTSVPVPAIEN